MPGKAHHYGVTVSDIENSLEFYRDTLGLDVDDRFTLSGEAFSTFVGVDDADVEIVFLEGNGCAVELLEYRSPPGGNANEGVSNNDVGAAHFCFEVSDLPGLYEDLRDEAEFISPPQTLSSGATVVYARDPDGNVLEFLEP